MSGMLCSDIADRVTINAERDGPDGRRYDLRR